MARAISLSREYAIHFAECWHCTGGNLADRSTSRPGTSGKLSHPPLVCTFPSSSPVKGEVYGKQRRDGNYLRYTPAIYDLGDSARLINSSLSWLESSIPFNGKACLTLHVRLTKALLTSKVNSLFSPWHTLSRYTRAESRSRYIMLDERLSHPLASPCVYRRYSFGSGNLPLHIAVSLQVWIIMILDMWITRRLSMTEGKTRGKKGRKEGGFRRWLLHPDA